MTTKIKIVFYGISCMLAGAGLTYILDENKHLQELFDIQIAMHDTERAIYKELLTPAPRLRYGRDYSSYLDKEKKDETMA